MTFIELLEPRIAPAAILHGHHLHAAKQKKIASATHHHFVKLKQMGIVHLTATYSYSGASDSAVSFGAFFGGSVTTVAGFDFAADGGSESTTNVAQSSSGALTLSAAAFTPGYAASSGALVLVGDGSATLESASTSYAGGLAASGGTLSLAGSNAAALTKTAAGTAVLVGSSVLESQPAIALGTVRVINVVSSPILPPSHGTEIDNVAFAAAPLVIANGTIGDPTVPRTLTLGGHLSTIANIVGSGAV